MNQKFQRLREEVLAAFGRPEGDRDLGELPAVSADGLDADGLEAWQVRLYHYWERAKHFPPEQLDEQEQQDCNSLAAHLERCLGMLHAMAGPAIRP